MGGDGRDDCVAFTGACVALILPGQVRQICSLGSSRLFDIFWRVRVLACHAGSLILWHFFPCSLYWFLNSYALALMQCCLSLKPQFNHGEHSEHSEHGGNLGFRAFPVVTCLFKAYEPLTAFARLLESFSMPGSASMV